MLTAASSKVLPRAHRQFLRLCALSLAPLLLVVATAAQAACPAGRTCVEPQAGDWQYWCNGPYPQPGCGGPFPSEAAATQSLVDRLINQYYQCSVDIQVAPYVNPQLFLGVEKANSTNSFTYTSIGSSVGNPACQVTYTRNINGYSKQRKVDCPRDAGGNLTNCWRLTVDPAKNTGCTNCKEGNPINPVFPNKFQVETDYVGQGPLPLEFRRTYNSYKLTSSDALVDVGPSQSIGVRWRHTYMRAVGYTAGTDTPGAWVYRPDGKNYWFLQSGGQFVPDADISAKLEQISGGWH